MQPAPANWTEHFITPTQPVMDDEAVVVYIEDIAPRGEPEEGFSVLQRVRRFEAFELRDVPIDWLDPSNRLSDVDPAAVDLYADTPFGDAPPIVIDGKDRVIIDGYHRFNAALRRGDPTIRAYVGVKPRADWQPFEEGVTADPSSLRYQQVEETPARKPGFGAPR